MFPFWSFEASCEIFDKVIILFVLLSEWVNLPKSTGKFDFKLFLALFLEVCVYPLSPFFSFTAFSFHVDCTEVIVFHTRCREISNIQCGHFFKILIYLVVAAFCANFSPFIC